METTDYYAHLGIDPSSPPEEIARAYRRLARQYHPDLNPHDADAARCFKEINEAYQVLSDPEKRAQYDLQRAGSHSSLSSESPQTGSTQNDQPMSRQRNIHVEWENVGDLSAAMEQAAKVFAGELQGVLQEFSAELDSMSQTFRADTRDLPGRWRSAPPSPPNGRPPRHGRPPRDGKAPKR